MNKKLDLDTLGNIKIKEAIHCYNKGITCEWADKKKIFLEDCEWIWDEENKKQKVDTK